MSNRVRERRLAMRFTQAALANKTGISRQALLAIEANRAAPSVKVALRLAHALGTTVDALFSDDVAARAEPLQSQIGGRVAMAWIGERWIALALDERDIAADALAANGHATFLRNADEARRNVIVMVARPCSARFAID